MVRKFSFGKVDGYHNGRKSCEVTLEFGFREYSGQEPYFTVCANLWNCLHTDILWGGQCVDELAEEFPILAHNKQYKRMMELWKECHLKNMSEIPNNIVDEINKIVEGE